MFHDPLKDKALQNRIVYISGSFVFHDPLKDKALDNRIVCISGSFVFYALDIRELFLTNN